MNRLQLEHWLYPKVSHQRFNDPPILEGRICPATRKKGIKKTTSNSRLKIINPPYLSPAICIWLGIFSILQTFQNHPVSGANKLIINLFSWFKYIAFIVFINCDIIYFYIFIMIPNFICYRFIVIIYSS